MVMLSVGVVLWSAAHLLKRLAPNFRARLGTAGRLLVTIVILAALVLMIQGYPSAQGPVWWGRQTPLVGVNNLLVYLGFYCIAGKAVGARVAGVIRHPQLTAVSLWAIAHLLVNGDAPSLVLFGGLLAWSVASIAVINHQDGKPALPKPTPSLLREIAAVVITLALYGATAYVHGVLGYPVHG